MAKNQVLFNYIENDLATEVSEYLYNYNENVYPNVTELYSDDNYFYEGTVRAVIATFLQNFIQMHQVACPGYLLVSEQPLPGWAVQRADIIITDLNEENIYYVVIEVKADFNVASAGDDMTKLLEQINEENIDYGFVFFMAADQQTANAQSNQLNNEVGNPDDLMAIGIPAVPPGDDMEDD